MSCEANYPNEESPVTEARHETTDQHVACLWCQGSGVRSKRECFGCRGIGHHSIERGFQLIVRLVSDMSTRIGELELAVSRLSEGQKATPLGQETESALYASGITMEEYIRGDRPRGR